MKCIAKLVNTCTQQAINTLYDLAFNSLRLEGLNLSINNFKKYIIGLILTNFFQQFLDCIFRTQPINDDIIETKIFKLKMTILLFKYKI